MNVTSWSVAFLKSKDPLSSVKPMWIITPPGFTHLIDCCLVSSNPTVSKTMSKWSLIIALLFGLKPSASKYFKLSFNLLSLGSTILIFLQFLTFFRLQLNKAVCYLPPYSSVLLIFFFKPMGKIFLKMVLGVKNHIFWAQKSILTVWKLVEDLRSLV